MADYTDNALLASIKALEQVVLPAVDARDPLATEQLRLAAGFFKFVRARLDLWYPRHVFELNHYLELAQMLREDARALSDAVAERLESAIEQACAVKAASVPLPADMRRATATLSECASAVARIAAAGDAQLRRRVERQVLAHSKRWVDMQRAWFLPQGFELRPDALPSLEQALSLGASPPRDRA
ncbi:MAG TPA: hypothetical protein VLJ86_18090 [Ramlibacter sp.]|nr:hypothetical protein [Ramlibacter sp.]